MRGADLNLALVVAAVAFPVVLLVSSVLFRAGGLRYLARFYWSEKMPFYARNHPFAFGPLGLGAACMPVALVATQSAEVSRDGLLSLALPGWFAFILLALVWAWHPPEFMKPAWLREEEARRGPSQYPTALIDRVLIGCLAVGFSAALLAMVLGSIAKWISWVFAAAANE